MKIYDIRPVFKLAEIEEILRSLLSLGYAVEEGGYVTYKGRGGFFPSGVLNLRKPLPQNALNLKRR